MVESFRQRLRDAFVVVQPLERMKILVTKGEAGLVAGMLMQEPKAMVLADAEKRALVTRALQKRLEMVQDPTVIKAVERKIKSIGNGQKEGKALKRQLEQLFPDARAK